MLTPQLLVGPVQNADDFHDESFFHRGELGFDARRRVQSDRTPSLEREVHVRQQRSERDEKHRRSRLMDELLPVPLAEFAQAPAQH